MNVPNRCDWQGHLLTDLLFFSDFKMQIICAGFPKTGTKSMAMALRELGYTVYDFEEHIDFHLDKFVDFMDGVTDSAELMEAYKDVDVCVDQPTCTMWHIFFKHYPNAKVILMERDSSEAWFTSYKKMIDYYMANYHVWYEDYLPLLSKTQATMNKMSQQCMIKSTGSGKNFWQLKHISKESWIYQYEMHNAAVKQLVPADQLLVFKVGEGWDRLCSFLDKPIPDKPFPRENVAGQAGNIVDQMQEFQTFKKVINEVRKSLFIAGSCLTLSVGIGVLAFVRPKIFSKVISLIKLW